MVELKMIEVPEIMFDKILECYSADIIIREDIYNCFSGTPDNKKPVYTDNHEWIVCQEYLLDYVHKIIYGTDCIVGCTDWKQVRIRKVPGLTKIMKSYNGSYCYNFIMKIIKKFYNQSEIEEIFNSHSREYNEDLKQYHYFYDCSIGELIELENCVKYDINGAHASAVINLFPKAKNELLKVYNKKDQYKKQGDIESANKIKALFNYFVGMLCCKGYRGTYNYIVQTITEKLLSTIDELDGILVYANTDSACVMNPKNKLKDSKKLGEFKLEGEGTMYWYQDVNYSLLEYTNTKGGTEQVGSCKLAVRDMISLKNRQVVHYKATKTLVGTDANGRKHYVENLSNIIKEQL